MCKLDEFVISLNGQSFIETLIVVVSIFHPTAMHCIANVRFDFLNNFHFYDKFSAKWCVIGAVTFVNV